MNSAPWCSSCPTSLSLHVFSPSSYPYVPDRFVVPATTPAPRQDPMQDTTWHHVSLGFSWQGQSLRLVLFHWLWPCWGGLIRHFVHIIGIYLFFSWLDGVVGFEGADHRGEVLCHHCITRKHLSLSVLTWSSGWGGVGHASPPWSYSLPCVYGVSLWAGKHCVEPTHFRRGELASSPSQVLTVSTSVIWNSVRSIQTQLWKKNTVTPINKNIQQNNLKNHIGFIEQLGSFPSSK